MGLMINRPCIAWQAASRRQAGNEHIEVFFPEAIPAQGGGVGHLPRAQFQALGQPVGPRPHQADDVMAILQQCLRRGAANGAGGAEQHDALGT